MDAPGAVVEHSAVTGMPVGNACAPACGSRRDCGQCGGLPMPPGQHLWHYHLRPWMQATHWGYPEYFAPVPLGLSVHESFNTQVANGLAAQLILYRCDFNGYKGESAARLNEFGLGRLRRLIEPLATTPLPLMIEGEYGNPDLNTSRRQYVLNTLAVLAPVPIGPERVVIVSPPAAMSGVEALEQYDNMLKHLNHEGVPTTPDVPKWRFENRPR